MSRDKANLKLLIDRRDRLRLEFQTVRARLEEVESLIQQMSGESPFKPFSFAGEVKPRRGGLKEIILDLCEEAGEAGLSTAECVAIARDKRGVNLQPPSVSSTFSRFKADGVLMYDGERYRLKKYAGPRSATA